MAIYHCSVSIIGKNGGRSAVQFGAYIDGVRDHNARTGEKYDHTSKDEVVYSNMIFSEDVPKELRNRHSFWNALELHETSSDARFSRTWELAFDNAATLDQMKEQVTEFAESLMEDGYCAVQFAIHNKEENKHCHLMAPCRQMVKGNWEDIKEVKGYLCENSDGDQRVFRSVNDIPETYKRIPLTDEHGEQKTDSRGRKQWVRQYIKNDKLNSKEVLVSQRKRWAEVMNKYLSEEDKVSHLSYKKQGVDKVPTKHLGYKASQLEKGGVQTELGKYNRAVRRFNKLKHKVSKRKVRAQIELVRRLKEELREFIQESSRPIRSAEEKVRRIRDRKTELSLSERQQYLDNYKNAVLKSIAEQKAGLSTQLDHRGRI